jgi:hypothetical protein
MTLIKIIRDGGRFIKFDLFCDLFLMFLRGNFNDLVPEKRLSWGGRLAFPLGLLVNHEREREPRG